MAREVFNYESLVVGENVEVIEVLIAASQVISRGDLLVCAVTETFASTSVATEGTPNTVATTTTVARSVADSFSKAAAVANPKDQHAIAAVDITTGAGDTTLKIPVYMRGRFNAAKVGLGGGSSIANNAKVLRGQGIYLVGVQSGEIS